MSGYGIAIIAGLLTVVSAAVMVVAGSFAVIRHPDRNDNERNARRYVGPALFGLAGVFLGGLGLIVAGIAAVMSATT